MKVARKVARKSLKRQQTSRQTLTLPAEVYRQIESLRGDMPRSAFVEELIRREQKRRDREDFIARANAACTDAVCRETLRINKEFPIHGE